MRDLAIRLENRPGALAEMGEALGSAGVSVDSDHQNQLILVVDNYETGRVVSELWQKATIT